jgi:hypothetical protein
MTSPAAHDHDALADTLRRLLAESEGALRPGQLRLKLESALSPEELRRLRPVLHQLVAAAEENLPANLTRIAPLTVHSLQRLSGDLAQARGWSVQTAQRTTQIWASALGFADLAASSWPRTDSGARPGLSQPELAQAPTQLPPPVGPPAQLRAGRAPHPAGPAAPPPVSTWPQPARKWRHLTQAPNGEPTLGVSHAYAGIPLVLLVAAVITLTVVLCLPIFLYGAKGFLLPLLGALGAAGLVRLGRFGVLAASQSALSFTPYGGAWRKERPDQAVSVPWSDVVVRPGFVSVVQLGRMRIQVGPRNRAFVGAVAARAEGRR